MPWREKQVFDGRTFEINSKVLGSGAQGEVRLARAEDDHSVKAIVKTMIPEGHMAARLQHLHGMGLGYALPHVCAPLAIDISGSHLRYLAAWSPGVTVDADPPRSLPELLEIACKAATIWARLEALGIAHGDIAPGNVLIRPNGMVDLIDLDNYVLANNSALSDPPKIGQHPMMAPELRLARNTNQYVPPDILSDRFAWTVLLSYLLLSRHPVPSDVQDPASVDAIMTSGHWPEDGRSLQPGDLPATALGQQLNDLFRAGFGLDRSARPSADQWRLSLVNALQGVRIHGCGAAFVPDGSTGNCHSCGGTWVTKAPQPALLLIDPQSGQSIDIDLPEGSFVYIGRGTIPWASAYVSEKHLLVMRQGRSLYLAHKGSNPTWITFAGEHQRRQLVEYQTNVDAPEIAGATLTLADLPLQMHIQVSP